MVGKLFYRNFILVYRVSNWVRQRFTPAGMLLLSTLVASGTFGINTRQTLSYQIFTLSGSLLLIAMFSILFLRARFSVNRSLPAYGTEGEDLEYRLSISNDSKATQQDLLLFDELATNYPTYPEFKISTDSEDRHRNIIDRFIGYPRLLTSINRKRGASIMPVELRVIAAGETVERKVTIHPLRRGYLYFQQARVAKPDLLGLFRAVMRLPLQDRLLVLPRRYRLPQLTMPGRRKYQHGGMNLATAVGDSQEFFSLRDYRPGDPLRAIHWRSYAKKGTPVVKEQQDEYFSRYGLVLDTFLERRSGLILEEAVSAAASVATSVRQHDALLDLMFIGREAYRFTSGRGLAGTENMLEILACVTDCSSAPFSTLGQLVIQHVAASSGFICILLDWDEQRRQFIKSLRNLQVPLTVMVISPDGKIPDTENDPMSDLPHSLWILEAGNMQQSLDRLARHT